MAAPDDNTFYFEALESVPFVPPRAILARHGYHPPRPEDVPANEVTGRLWELLYALAARRFFFHCTDHLDDAELYRHLCESFLNEPQADIPPEAEINCHHDCGGSGSGSATWLQYYADDEMRALIQTDFPENELPPKLPLPYDRDRFLPEPPNPLMVDAGDGGLSLEFLDDDDDDDGDDPLGLKQVDREIARVQHADEEEGLQEEWHRPVDHMKRSGYTPMPPEEITEEAVTPLLWELLHELSLRGFYVLRTDHVSDMELYSQLWRRGIREDSLMPGKRSRVAAWYHDLLGSCSDEDLQLDLRFYADDESRARHAQMFPGDVLPPKEPRLYSRDWRLPKGPF